MKKVLFIDRDGTLIVEPPDNFQVDSLSKLEFIPKVFSGLGRIARELDFDLVMVTNQDGLGTPSLPEADFWPAHEKMITAFRNEGIHFTEVLIDRSFPEENAPTRKPRTGLLGHYMRGACDMANSYVIGDRLTDVELAANLGCRAIYMGDGHADAELCSKDWMEIYRHLKDRPRVGEVLRNTSETRIEIRLNLDGTGKCEVQTGLGFFDHMLAQLARHGQMDLWIACSGDLHVDEHHTIEDVGLALGEAFNHALGSRKGIMRYGFLLPMDDCLAQVAVDFGGRPWLVWDAVFRRERIGEMPTEMFSHFFKSFSDTARCNLNIRAEGDNEHHKIESIFKAFAKAIRMAVSATGSEGIPSTKGIL